MELDARQQAEFVGEITRHQSALQNYIISLMPGVSGVSDVLQETNIVLWEKRDKFEIGTNFRAWAFAIARLEVKNHRRKLLKIGVPMLDEKLAEQLAEESQESPDEIDRRLSALEGCLGHLGEEQRQLIEHRYYSGESLESFAEECGRSCESLRVSLFRIRNALRKCIEKNLTPEQR